MHSMAALASARASLLPGLRVASWNIAAINNNPFEYWMTHPDERYEQIMQGMQGLVDAPGDADVPVADIFTEGMWAQLMQQMQEQGWAGLEETEEKYHSEFKNRRIVSEFLKDPEIGSKRLASMPDRVTNTITTADNLRICRPTPINAFAAGDMGSVEKWWPLYLEFFFAKEYEFKSGAAKVCSLLQPIKRAKYPAVSEQEERISVPLSCLCVAIFDCILVHLLHQLNPEWQDVRHSICTALGSQKVDKTLDILSNQYTGCDLIFIQEAAADLIGQIAGHSVLAGMYEVIAPEKMDLKRDQNSLILVKKDIMDESAAGGAIQNCTDAVVDKLNALLGASGLVMAGDIAAAIVAVGGGEKLLLASFHGDTNGLGTIPVVRAVSTLLDELATEQEVRPKLVFGMDANSHTKGKPGKALGVAELAEALEELGMVSSWGRSPDPQKLTTYHARTYLQPQLNKAARRDQVREKGDAHCKDHFIVRASDFQVDEERGCLRDNTGLGPGQFRENMVFPTLDFPSDHAIISCELVARR